MSHPRADPARAFAMQARNILEDGVFVTKSTFYQVEISLYKMDDRFVEVWYDVKQKGITDIVYLDTRTVNPFLKHFGYVSQN